MRNIIHLVKDHATQNIPLKYEEAYELGCYVVESCKIDLSDNLEDILQITRKQLTAITQVIALLSSLHNRAIYTWQWNKKKEQLHGHRLPLSVAEQIAGICVAVFEQDIARSEFGFLKPKVDYAMDNCGMGGDLIVTANISTIAGFIAGAAGIPMCKHGSPGNSQRCGSSDFISECCGINIGVTREEMQFCVEQHNFGYTEALDTRYKHIHDATHKIAMMPHMNDIIGPITNPIDPNLMRRRVVGINHLMSPRVVAEAYQIMNKKGVTHLDHGLFVRGFTDKDCYEGIDEVSICEGGTMVAELKDGKIREYYLYAKDFGLKPISPEEVSPPDRVSKGEYSMQILRGEIDGPRLQIVLANAALLFYLAGRSADLKECYQLAEQTFRSGRVQERMLAVKETLVKNEVLC